MKKIVIGILVVMISLSCISCGRVEEIFHDNEGKKVILSGEKNSELKSSLEAIPVNYNFEDGVKKGYVVNIHGNIKNEEKLFEFMGSEKDGRVIIANFTIEGDAIVTEIIRSNKKMHLYIDNRRDKFSVEEERTIESWEIEKVYRKQKKGIEEFYAKTKNKKILLFMANLKEET